MDRQDKDDRDGILALLEEVADHDQDGDEAEQELLADGVNVSSFLARLQQAIDAQKTEDRLAWRVEARARAAAFATTEAPIATFAHMSRAELVAEARKLAHDVHFKRLEEQTDDDIRTLLADRARLEEFQRK